MKPVPKTSSIFYAHNKTIYGTQQELEEVDFLKNKFHTSNVICPHFTVGELNDPKDYLHIVDCCQKTIVSEINGHIGLAEFVEVARAFSNSSPVLALRKRDTEFNLSEVIGIEIVNRADCKNKYAKIIIKK